MIKFSDIELYFQWVLLADFLRYFSRSLTFLCVQSFINIPGERFNIMTFSSGGNDRMWFKDDLQFVTPETLQEALVFVESINANGG